jgi:signal peptidase II
VILAATAAVVLALDLVTKLIAANGLEAGHSIPVVGDLVRLTLVHNSGAAFGLFPGSRGPFVAFSIAAIGLILLLYLRLPGRSRLELAAMGALLGGALGNLVDRLRAGVVVDFIDIGLGTLRWPVFNLADIAVTGGVALLLLGVARHRP